MPNENSAITMKTDHLPLSLGPDIEVTPLGLRFHGEPDFKKWSALGRKIGQALRSMEFVIGDWLVYGERNFKSTGGRPTNCDYETAVRATGIDVAILRNYAYVSRKVTLSLRNDKVSWEHHRAVAKLPAEKQKHWIDLAANQTERISYRRLRTSINADRLVSVEELTTPSCDRAIITHIPPINRLTLWWEETGGRDWLRTRSKPQLRNMLVDFRRVIEIVKAIQDEFQIRPDEP
jgi:hypothetical protein